MSACAYTCRIQRAYIRQCPEETPLLTPPYTKFHSKMDYSYLNQAAANFDATACSLTTGGMDPTGLGSCTYGDLASCSQMSQAYRYTAASMARSYNHTGNTGPAMGHSLTAGSMGQCAIMGSRAHQDHQRPPMFPSMNLQGRCKYTSIFAASFPAAKIIVLSFRTWCRYTYRPLCIWLMKFTRHLSHRRFVESSRVVYTLKMSHFFRKPLSFVI